MIRLSHASPVYRIATDDGNSYITACNLWHAEQECEKRGAAELCYLMRVDGQPTWVPATSQSNYDTERFSELKRLFHRLGCDFDRHGRSLFAHVTSTSFDVVVNITRLPDSRNYKSVSDANLDWFENRINSYIENRN
ncbi:hypothetical protein [Marinobacterium jannaschii]|uniref:hypothetical protein n=1 Tax=Marinobacterium jannaschii TaxID=64970 RepID=UPI00047F5B68|nr:hypothetical protein [Marinobacterium jannaschii]